jgi:hypothetical protein
MPSSRGWGLHKYSAQPLDLVDPVLHSTDGKDGKSKYYGLGKKSWCGPIG